ncbi:hypothetical protein MTR67_013911 [Solanum verrucosum]|uniref:Uncharacterized protein n=1 Tax=Solanum verrucosum TaxID=315347 RepID=A0AAF0TID0_SOLVR|nr:hypothetical protein MTR67_013911 [Solanum verrucosum]
MDVKGKTKDNPKARMDIKEYCRRKELWLQELQNGKIVKPKDSFSFTLDEKREIIEWVKNLRMPEGYASNLGKRADMNEGKLIEIQSYVNLFVNPWGNEAIYTEFFKWLRNYVYDEYSSVQHLQLAKEVALGPESQVLAMNKDKVDCWVVIKSKHVGRIEIDNVLDVAYQNDVAIVQQQVDVELETTLQHPQHILEEVSDDEILNVEEEKSENEENESFDDEEWDDNENETTEEEEWENDGIETNEEE